MSVQVKYEQKQKHNAVIEVRRGILETERSPEGIS